MLRCCPTKAAMTKQVFVPGMLTTAALGKEGVNASAWHIRLRAVTEPAVIRLIFMALAW